jgi:hypothetical protein
VDGKQRDSDQISPVAMLLEANQQLRRVATHVVKRLPAVGVSIEPMFVKSDDSRIVPAAMASHQHAVPHFRISTAATGSDIQSLVKPPD